MNTDHPLELISAWADGELPQHEQARLEEHLRGCDACRILLADFRTLAATARREPIPGLPADLAARIRARTATVPRPTPAPRVPIFRMRLPLATAAAALLLVSMWIVWQGRIPERIDEEQKAATGSLPAELPAPSETATPAAPSVRLQRVAARDTSPPPPSAPAPADATRPAAEAPPPAAPRADAPPPAMAESAKVASPPDDGEASFAPAASVHRERRIPATTLVFHLPEGQVTVTSEHVVTIVSGDYLCRFDAIGPVENEALDRLFELAHTPEPAPRRASAAGASGGSGGPGESAASPEAARDEITIAAPGEPGSSSPGVTAEMQRRLRALLAERYLPRAEAACGTPPAALRQLH